MDSVILNPDDHSIGHLPPEILLNIFHGLRGNVLIKLTNVCRSFNQTIGSSRELMDKIRLKVLLNANRSIFELEEVLSGSARKYEHISLIHAQCDDSSCVEFIQNNRSWKSLKLSNCHFRSVDSKVKLLSLVAPTLEEAEFGNVNIDQHDRELVVFNHLQQPVRTVFFPKLLKLKSDNLQDDDFHCTTLKVLDLSLRPHQSRVWERLRINQSLEELTMTCEVVNLIFERDIVEMGISFKLKKLQMQAHQNFDGMKSTSNRNFQTFFKSQSETIEELVIDWFSERRLILDPADNLCIEVLTTVFQGFKVIRKLIVTYKQGFFSDPSCPSVAFLNIASNPSITELRLRFEKAPLSDVLFEKLVTACPNVKNLFVHEMDQSLLECCARHLKNIESIFAFSFKVDCLPNDRVKFKNLSRVSFRQCVVKNLPELNGKKLFEQNSIVLKTMT